MAYSNYWKVIPQFVPLNGLQENILPFESVQCKQSAFAFSFNWKLYGKNENGRNLRTHWTRNWKVVTLDRAHRDIAMITASISWKKFWTSIIPNISLLSITDLNGYMKYKRCTNSSLCTNCTTHTCTHAGLWWPTSHFCRFYLSGNFHLISFLLLLLVFVVTVGGQINWGWFGCEVTDGYIPLM